MKQIFLTALILFYSLFSIAQVNTEKYRKYGTKPGFNTNLGLNVGYEKGNSNYLTTEAKIRFDYNMIRYNFFLVGSIDYKDANEEKVKNKGFAHFRAIRKLSKVFSTEAFAQLEYDEFIDLNERLLLGGGIRLNPTNAGNKPDSLRKLDFHIGIGMMYEDEEYQNLESGLNFNTEARSTNYLSVDYDLTQTANIAGVFYYQPLVRDFSDFRFMADAVLEVKVLKRLFLQIVLHYKYDSRPEIVDVKYDLELENGLRFNL